MRATQYCIVSWLVKEKKAVELVTRAVESEVPSSDSDSNSDSGPTPTFSCISYLKR